MASIMKKDYLNVEVTQLLLEKLNKLGEVIDNNYRWLAIKTFISPHNKSHIFNEGDIVGWDCGDKTLPAYHLYNVQQWLRNKHNIDVCPFIETTSPYKDYCCRIYKNGKFVCDKVAYADDYHDCLNDSIKTVLNYI